MKKLNSPKQKQNTAKKLGENELKINPPSLSKLSETELDYIFLIGIG